jgi:F-type H+-transporting ATPase subunit b
VLAQRREKIESDLDAAERARAEADAALAAYEASLVGAREAAHTAVGEASQAAQKAAEARNKELDSEIARQIEEAQRAIAGQKTEAMENLSGMAAEAARAATAKLVGVDVGEAEAQQAVAAAKER